MCFCSPRWRPLLPDDNHCFLGTGLLGAAIGHRLLVGISLQVGTVILTAADR